MLVLNILGIMFFGSFVVVGFYNATHRCTQCMKTTLASKGVYVLETAVQYCAKSEDNFQNVPFISYKFTFFQTTIMKPLLIQY